MPQMVSKALLVVRPAGFRLLIRVLEFNHFKQDYSEWETLKARYARQSGSALPDSKLVATLLSQKTGALQQHLSLNICKANGWWQRKGKGRGKWPPLPKRLRKGKNRLWPTER